MKPSICSSTIEGTKTKRSICSPTIEVTKTKQSICSSTIEGTKTKRSIRSSTIDDLPLLVLTHTCYTLCAHSILKHVPQTPLALRKKKVNLSDALNATSLMNLRSRYTVSWIYQRRYNEIHRRDVLFKKGFFSTDVHTNTVGRLRA
jgi:hypothetical protein